MGDDFATAFIGDSYEDATERYRESGDNRVSAEDLQKWWENRSSNDPQDKMNFEKYKDVTEPHTSLYALHICKKECLRTSNQNVGGGSVSFIPGEGRGQNLYWRIPHFKRMAGGSSGNYANDCSLKEICNADTNYPSDDPDRENVTVRNPLVNNFLRLKIEKNNVEIEDSLIEVDYWPQRIPSQKYDVIINHLGNICGQRLTGGSKKIRLTEKYEERASGNRLITYTDSDIQDVKLSIRHFGKNNIRIYRCKTDELDKQGQKILGDFKEWGGSNQRKIEREYKYDKNEMILLWIPDDNNVKYGDWKKRCSNEVHGLIEKMSEGKMGKHFFPFVAPDYDGFFILIGRRDRIEGSQLPFIGKAANMDILLLEIKKSMKSKGFPFYKFLLNQRNLEIIWLQQNTLISNKDYGLQHTLKSDNGEIHIMISSEEKNNQDEEINWIDLKLENETGKEIISQQKIKTAGGKNASLSLRIKKKGDYRVVLRTSQNHFRILNVFVEKDSDVDNSIYCKGKTWVKMSQLNEENSIIAEPGAHKKLCKKILENDFLGIKDYIDYDNKNWRNKDNRKGLMIEINRAIFQKYRDDNGCVDGGTWTRFTNRLYTAIEGLNWPNLEQSERLTVPKIGVLQVLSGDHYPEAIWNQDIIINWKWKTWEYEHLSEEIGGEMEGWRIIHSTKTFKQLKDGKRYSKIGIDYQTGFRFGYSEIKDEPYLDSLLQKRGIEEEPIDFLEKLWGVIEDYPITNIKENRRRMRYDPGKKLTDSGRTDAWSMLRAFPWHSEQAGAKNSANTWQELINDGVGVDLDFDNQRGEDRRQLFLEVNYYDGEKFDAWDRLPAELYLGCLYQTNGEISEKKVLVGTTDGWNEDRKSNLKWIKQEDSMIGTKKGSDLPNLIHLLYPKNSYSDTRYLEREILRAFRTIYENQNNNLLSIKTYAGLDIPNWAVYSPSEDDNTIIDIKIQGFMRYIEQSPNAMKESEENLKQIMINNLIQKFWWKGEFKSE